MYCIWSHPSPLPPLPQIPPHDQSPLSTPYPLQALRSSVLKANVLGVYGIAADCGGRNGANLDISHCLSEHLESSDNTGGSLSSETMARSSISVTAAARMAAVGMRERTPRITFRAKMIIMKIVTPNEALACWQYPLQLCCSVLAISQLCVIYQAMLLGCAGSEWSGPAWPYALTIQRMVMMVLTRVPKRGNQRWSMNKVHFTSNRKAHRIAIASLKSVIFWDHTNGVVGIGW